MKNKKLLNIYLLSFALIALITFILPITKIDTNSVESLFVTIVYYITNILIVISLVLVISIAIINLLADNYEGVKYMEALSFIALIMASINVIIYSSNLFYALSWGYTLFIIELFVLNSLNRLVKIIKSSKSIGSYLKFIFSLKNKVCKETLNNDDNENNGQITQTSDTELKQKEKK